MDRGRPTSDKSQNLTAAVDGTDSQETRGTTQGQRNGGANRPQQTGRTNQPTAVPVVGRTVRDISSLSLIDRKPGTLNSQSDSQSAPNPPSAFDSRMAAVSQAVSHSRPASDSKDAKPISGRRFPASAQTAGGHSAVPVSNDPAGLAVLPLVYSRNGTSEPSESSEPSGSTQSDTNAAAQTGGESYLDSLPPWARRLLDQPDSRGTSPIRSPMRYQAQNTTQTSFPVRTPSYPAATQVSQPISQPAPVVLRESGNRETEPKPRMDEGEIRRMADKVYRLIEDRISRELRRTGR